MTLKQPVGYCRVLICDDQSIVREGLALLLGLERDVEVVGIAEDGADAVDKAVRLAPDVVLMIRACTASPGSSARPSPSRAESRHGATRRGPVAGPDRR